MRFRAAAAWSAMVAAMALVAAPVFGQVPAQVVAQALPRSPAADNELLGFSRYLPADARGYASALQLGKLRHDIAASNAWARVEAVPELKRGLDAARANLESNEVPSVVRAAIEMLKTASETEMSLAVAGDSSQDILNVVRVALTSVAVLAPSPHAPDTLQGQVLETKLAPLRAEWTTALPKVRLPSLVFAARVKEPTKHRAFLEALLDLAWMGAQARIESDALPESRAGLREAYAHVKVGDVSMIRLRLRVGDVVPMRGFFEELDRAPLGDAEKQLIVQALTDLTVEAHLGFLGEYLTLAVGSDDRFIKQIVDIFEGREKATLAASPGFATIRAELAPSALGILYADNTELQRELQRSILPLVNKLADPELHALLGAPAEITAGVQRMQIAFERGVLNAPLKQEGVIKVDHGLKQSHRTEFDRKPASASTKPLATLALIPEKSIGYLVARHGTLENYFEQVKYVIEQQRAQMNVRRRRYGDFGDETDLQTKLLEALVEAIDKKLAPSLKGEMGVVLGPFTDFGVKEGKGPPIRGIPIPTLALLVHTADADKAIAGIRDIFTAFVDIVVEQRHGRGGVPVKFLEHDLDGIPTWIFQSDLLIVDGLEPHFAKIGGALVFSSSFELTKKMRGAAKGTSPNIAATPAHQALKDLLPVGAEQAMYVDGGELNRNLRSATTAVFGLIDKNPSLFNLRENDLEQMVNVKRAIDVTLGLAECFRGSASSLVSEGKLDVLREWVNIEDLKAK